jgi:DUF4097 and DUF4098 domain-containing protein YvlB
MKPTIAVLAALQTLSINAFAQGLNRSLDASPSGHVAIEFIAGEVTVRGWDQAVIEVSGDFGGAAEALEVTQQGEQTTIRIREDAEGGAALASEEVDLFVSMPRGSSLSVDGTNADLLIASVEGEMSLETVSGDIEAEVFGAALEAHTLGGDVNVASRGAPATVNLTTVAGEIEAAGTFLSIMASTVSGDIELDVLEVASMNLTTTNGEIEVHATLDGAAEINAETTNGDVELRVGEENDLNIDIGTFSGRIRTCFDRPPEGAGVDAQTGPDGGRRGRQGRQGQRGGELVIEADADSPRVRVRTLNGDIEICSS